MAQKWSSIFRVGIYKCHMTYYSRPSGLTCRWEPDLPPAKSLSDQEWAQYRSGRDALLAEVGKAVGVLVVET